MRALISGVTGQDGHYLSEFLLEKGYTVYGLIRRTSSPPKVPNGVIAIEGDVMDPGTVKIVERLKPDEVYNLAGQSYVLESFNTPQATFHINTFGCFNMIEGARLANAKFYQASTSEMFGLSPPPHNEGTPFYPRSPYGNAKLAAHWHTIGYRERFNMYAVAGILFNHESPLRGHEFLSQKVCTAAARIKLGKQDSVELGNLEARRDWGHAKDFVKGMWMMLQQPQPKELIFATGVNHSVRDFVKKAFDCVGLNWEDYVKFNPKFLRPTEVPDLLGDPTEAIRLGWKPEYTFETLVEEMVDAALERESN